MASQKYRIYHRWVGLGGIDVEDAVSGENLRLSVDWLRWMSGYRFSLAGIPARVHLKETLGTVTVLAACDSRQITITGKKKLIGKEAYDVSNESGPLAALRVRNRSTLLLRPNEAPDGADADESTLAEICEVRNFGAVYWTVESPAPIDPLLLAAIALIVRRHGTPQYVR